MKGFSSVLSLYFVAAVSMEGVHVISGQGPLVSLSIQQILNCTYNSKYGNAGCDGGYMGESIQYVVDVGGIESTQAAPYYSSEGAEGECEYDASKSVAKFDGVVMLSKSTEEELMEALTIAPVAGVMGIGQNFIVRTS